MNLEDIEQIALNYLEQTTNPLVQISVLYDHIKSKSEDDIVSLQDFTDFLKEHDLIKIMDPLVLTSNKTLAQSLKVSGLTSSPCAILSTRIPSAQDLAAAMVDQLSSMTQALSTALAEARSIGNTEKAHEIYETLERIKALEGQLIEHTRAH